VKKRISEAKEREIERLRSRSGSKGRSLSRSDKKKPQQIVEEDTLYSESDEAGYDSLESGRKDYSGKKQRDLRNDT
jgi:hypothetical protein